MKRSLAFTAITAGIILVGFGSYSLGIEDGQRYQKALYPVNDSAMPLAIVHAGEPFPPQLGIYSEPPGAALAGSDLAIMYTPDAMQPVTIMSLSRIQTPCGYPDPLDPSLDNYYRPCGSVVDIHHGTATLTESLSIIFRPGLYYNDFNITSHGIGVR